MYFPLSIQMNILTLYNNCCVILSKHMLDSALAFILFVEKSFLNAMEIEIDSRYGK